MAAAYYGVIDEVRVMLIDNDKEIVTKTVDLLKSYDYKVTTVGTSSEAMSMLSKGNKNIDVMIISVDSPNLDSFKLLAQAVALDIILLFVSDEHNEFLIKKALKEGAYLFLKKPLDKEIVKYLWQFVLREKIQREKARKGSEENEDQMIVDNIGKNNIVGHNEEQSGEKNIVPNIEDQRNNIHEAENNVISNGKYKPKRNKRRKNTKEINEGESRISAVRQKNKIEWTTDLHVKFMESLQQLGEGRCYPLDILEVMNVPGLTRMQVASHLQKCRTYNWRAPEERKSSRHPSIHESLSGSQQESGIRKFGAMPHLQKNISNKIQKSREFSFPTLNTNSIFARGESSIQEQLYPPQVQVQPHYLNIGNSSNNLVLSAQNNIGGALQQQHRPLFGMLGSQEIQSSIIRSTNYRSGLIFNSGDLQTQSDYNLDLNVAHETTYPGSKIMSDTDATINYYNLNVNPGNATIYSGDAMMSDAYVGNTIINGYNMNVNADNVTTYSGSTIMSDSNVGNATINESGAAKANFQQYIGESNMSYPSNIVATSYKSDTEGSDSNEKENCYAYSNVNNMDYLFQNLGPPGANLPNEYDR